MNRFAPSHLNIAPSLFDDGLVLCSSAGLRARLSIFQLRPTIGAAESENDGIERTAESSLPHANALMRNLRAVGDDELSQARGGFLTANGVEFDFGANVQTLVNGQLALQTTVQWTSAGANVQQTSGTGTNVVAIPASQLTALFGLTTGIAANGVQITAPSGSIEVAANVTGAQVQNLVANSASNQAITQNTAVTLAIYNFASWQQQLAQNAISNQLANEVIAASHFSH